MGLTFKDCTSATGIDSALVRSIVPRGPPPAAPTTDHHSRHRTVTDTANTPPGWPADDAV